MGHTSALIFACLSSLASCSLASFKAWAIFSFSANSRAAAAGIMKVRVCSCRVSLQKVI